jgi:hypothetical protein
MTGGPLSGVPSRLACSLRGVEKYSLMAVSELVVEEDGEGEVWRMLLSDGTRAAAAEVGAGLRRA